MDSTIHTLNNWGLLYAVQEHHFLTIVEICVAILNDKILFDVFTVIFMKIKSDHY